MTNGLQLRLRLLRKTVVRITDRSAVYRGRYARNRPTFKSQHGLIKGCLSEVLVAVFVTNWCSGQCLMT